MIFVFRGVDLHPVWPFMCYYTMQKRFNLHDPGLLDRDRPITCDSEYLFNYTLNMSCNVATCVKIPASGAMHGPYCGDDNDDLPVLYSLRGGSLTLLFNTDGFRQRTGFNITYTAFSKLTQLDGKNSYSRDIHLIFPMY